ncbi:MAG: TIGR04438 family Trp-rich protein [Burkholderiaceae bacterium]|nr:TIGR04438 family Trp-rich protein [Burkholderiaceae bacterium]
MYLLGIGVILLLLKVLEVAPVAGWHWAWILTPFGLAAAWWAVADATGYSKRKAMEAMEKRKQDRIEKQRESLGIAPRKRR